MVWLGVCSKGITPLVVLNEGTVDHAVYFEKVFPVALKHGNEVSDSDWILQQDGAKPRSHYLTQQWSWDNFPISINSENWRPNSPDVNPVQDVPEVPAESLLKYLLYNSNDLYFFFL